MEDDESQEDYHVELRGPFYHTKNNSEKVAVRTRTASGRMDSKDHCYGEKSHYTLGQEYFDTLPLGTTAFSNSNSNSSIDNLGHSQVSGRRRWEEDRSKIFRHKLQESKHLLKLTEKNPSALERKSLDISSIDKLHGATKSSSNSSSVVAHQKEKKCSSVILYSYQNPPFSLPPSGGCRKSSGHSSLPIEYRNSMVKALPPIGIKVDGDKEPPLPVKVT